MSMPRPDNVSRNGLLLVISDLGSGGTQQVVSHIASHWAAQGRRVGVLTLASPDTDFFPLDQRVERLATGGVGTSHSLLQRVAGNLGRITALRKSLKAFDGETAIGFIGPTNVLLVLASVGLGYRVVISERNDPTQQSFGPFWDLLRRLIYRFADVVSANSRGAIDALRAYVPSRKLVYLPNPLRQQASPPEGTARREAIILNVGRLHHQKGQDILIKAFSLITNQLPGWRVCIVGEGEERATLEALIEDHSLEKSVELVGRVTDPFPWYQKAGIFAFPSRWEGMPNALMEALSCGLPCIVSNAIRSHNEIITHGEEGLIVPGDNPEALAKAIHKLVKDDRLRSHLGHKAKTAASKLTRKDVFQTWDAVLWPKGQGKQ